MSWRQRRQAARQRRQEILRDLRENGWRSFAARKGQQVRQVVAQGTGKAFAAGKKAAHHVLSIQRAAGLNRKLVERSARSVVMDSEPRHQSPGHQKWVNGYAKEVRARMPDLLPEPEKAPEWFERNPHEPRKDDVELEA
jgi:hypothetical protein